VIGLAVLLPVVSVGVWASDGLSPLQVGDALPPEVIEFDFEPKAVNTGISDQVVTIKIHLTDDWSGVEWGKVMFTSPSGALIEEDFDVLPGGLPTIPRCTSEDEGLNVFCIIPLVIRQHSEAGTWALLVVIVRDRADNVRRLGRNYMETQGFPTTFLVADEVHTVHLPVVLNAQEVP